MDFPDDLEYAETHEWVRRGSDGVAVGITDYAQTELTDIVFVELPEVNRRMEAGEEMASLESVKAVGYVYAPVAGTVVAVNESLRQTPELVNQDPYGEGWIARIMPAESGETVELMSAEAYRQRIESEEGDEVE